MKTTLLKLAALACVAALVAGCNKSGSANRKSEEPITGRASDPAVEMKAEWKAGQRYLFRLDLALQNEMPIGRRGNPNAGPLRQMETTLGQDYTITVTNVASDGGRALELEILAVQMDIASGDSYVLNFDSENPGVSLTENATTDQLQKLVGGKIRYQVSADNKVMRMDGMRELMDRVGSGGGRGNRGPGGPGGVVGRIFTPQYFRQLVEFAGLPPQPVTIGESWPVRREISVGQPNPFPVDLTATFRGWQKHENRNCARTDFTGDLAPKATNTTASAASTNRTSDVRRLIRAMTGPPGNPMNIEKGTVVGKTWFDPSIGFSVETQFDQTVVTRNTVFRRPPSTNAPPAMTTNVSTTRQVVSIKLLDVAAVTP